jgi:hypothetical protein
MLDLAEQLRDYYDSIATPVTVDEIIGGHTDTIPFDLLATSVDDAVEPVEARTEIPHGDELLIDFFPLRDEGNTPTERRALFGIATAVAAAILVVVGVLVAGGNNSGVVTDSASSPLPPISVSSPDVTPPASAPGEADLYPSPQAVDALGYQWSRSPHEDDVLGDEVPFTGGMTDVVVGGPGLVAVGQADDGAAVWTSADGITWSRAQHDEAVFGDYDRPSMTSVTVGGPGLVAIGVDNSEPDSESDAVVWTSVDGITWARVPQEDAISGGVPVSVTAGGPGLVAVGRVDSGDDEDAAVWTSVDGIAWSRVPHDDAVFGGEHDQAIHSVTVGGPGLVAVGSESFLATDRGQLTNYDDITGVAVVWTSVDGLKWSRVPADEAVFGGEGNQWMNAVTRAGPGLVAVGGDWTSESHVAAVWTSVDGISWSRVPADEAVFGGDHDQLMLDVTPTAAGLVAVGRAWGQSGGNHSNGSDDSAASVWTSVDGVTWSWVGYDEAVFGSEDNTSFLLTDGPVFTEYRQFMNSVIATDIGLIAVGADWSGPSHGAAVWIAER